MKKNRFYLILLLIIGILTYYIEGYILTTVFYILLLVPVLSFGSILLTYNQFQVSHKVSKKKIVKGDKINYTLTLYNTNSLVYCPIRLKLESDKILFKDQFVTPTIVLYPKTQEEIVIPLRCNYRGYYRLGVKSIIIDDYFGLFSKEFKCLDAVKMIVYPSIKNLNYLPNTHMDVDEVTDSRNRTMEEQNNISYIREYEKGDTLNKIHWKLSSKYNELMVKQYSGEISNEVDIVLDSNKHYSDYELNIALEDKMIETCVMLINYLLIHNKTVNFIYNDVRNVAITGKDYNDFQRIYEECALLEFTRKFDFGKSIVEYYYRENNDIFINSNQYIIISNINEDLIKSLKQLNIQKIRITIVYIYFSDNKNNECLEKLNAEGYNIINISYDSDLDTLVEGTSL